MCSRHNRLGLDHYARCALRPKFPELRAELSNKYRSDSPCRIRREPTSPVSMLIARCQLTLILDGPWSSTFYGSISIASTTGNNVGTSSSFRDFSTRITQGYHLVWSRSQSKQALKKRAKPAVLRRLDGCFLKIGSVGNFNQLNDILLFLLLALQ